MTEFSNDFLSSFFFFFLAKYYIELRYMYTSHICVFIQNSFYMYMHLNLPPVQLVHYELCLLVITYK